MATAPYVVIDSLGSVEDTGYQFGSNTTRPTQHLEYATTPDADAHSVSQRGEWDGLGEQLWIYFAPVIFIVGVIGNILILVIMGKKKFAGTTTCVYLRAMALADLLVLFTGMLPEWVSATFHVTFKLLSAGTCKTEKFIQYSIGDAAIWTLVAFTIDRFVAVCFPMNKSEMCKASRSKYICIGLLLSAFAKNFHVIWTRGPEYVIEDGESVLKSNCARPEPYKTFETYIRPWIAFALISVVPFVIIIFCNTMIIRALIIAKRMNLGQSSQSKQEKTYTQLTFMCLSASFAFLVFITPSIVLLIGKPYWKHNNPAYDIAKAINNQLTYVNHSINFFLYCITGKRFRLELCRLFVCGRRALLLDTSTDSRTTTYKINPVTPTSTRKETKNGFYKLDKVDLNRAENMRQKPEVIDKRESSV